MATIDMKFSPAMEKAILEGRKCCTTRRTRHGKAGDFFVVGGRTYRILCVFLAPLWCASILYSGMEGFETPKEMRAWLKENYGFFWRLKIRYLHFFAHVPGTEEKND